MAGVDEDLDRGEDARRGQGVQLVADLRGQVAPGLAVLWFFGHTSRFTVNWSFSLAAGRPTWSRPTAPRSGVMVGREGTAWAGGTG
jgi:hypothetical protein